MNPKAKLKHALEDMRSIRQPDLTEAVIRASLSHSLPGALATGALSLYRVAREHRAARHPMAAETFKATPFTRVSRMEITQNQEDADERLLLSR